MVIFLGAEVCLANSSHDTAAGKKEKEKKITSSSIPIPPSALPVCEGVVGPVLQLLAVSRKS